jgi:hypothetical protein
MKRIFFLADTLEQIKKFPLDVEGKSVLSCAGYSEM